MVNLEATDRKQILDLLIPLSILTNERGRDAVMVSANLEQVRSQVDLSGPSAVAIPLLINFLCTYGRLTYEHEALGRLLNTISDYVGLEEQNFIHSIITKYNLMTPAVETMLPVSSTITISKEDIFEQIIGENTLRPIAFLQQAIEASRSIAYIEVASNKGKWSGTGFMISSDLLLTNHHVLPDKSLLTECVFRFNYQEDILGNPMISKDYMAVKDGIYWSNQVLDYALIQIAENPGNEWGVLPIEFQLPFVNSRVNIIQHPHGLPKQVSIQNNFVKFVSPKKIHYITSTQKGSSGSPVLDNNWRVLALHHAGGWIPEENENLLYFRNEGISIKSIINDIPEEIKGNLGH